MVHPRELRRVSWRSGSGMAHSIGPKVKLGTKDIACLVADDLTFISAV